MRTITFAALLAALQARDGNLKTDATAAACLTAASKELWDTTIPIPETVSGKTVTLTDTNKVAWSDLGYGSFYRFFDVDPSTSANVCFNRLPLLNDDGDGIRLNLCGLTVTTPFVLYRPAAPRYTSTVFNVLTVYHLEDLMLWTDGNCYRALTTTVAGDTPVSAAAKWQVQPVLEALEQALQWGARAERQGDLGKPDTYAAMYEIAKGKLDNARALFIANFPWCLDL